MPDDQAKPDRAENDPDKLSRLLELELIQKRAAWQQANARYKTLKSASLLFLLVVILAALIGFYFVFTRVNEQRGQQHPSPQPTPTGP